MKKYALIILVVIMCIGSYYIFNGINNVKIDYGESQLYSKQDMDLAIDIISKKNKNFDGFDVKVISIAYAGDEKSLKELVNGYDECIVFYSSFRTGNKTAALEPNTLYDEYQWFLCRKNGGEWILVSSGHA